MTPPQLGHLQEVLEAFPAWWGHRRATVALRSQAGPPPPASLGEGLTIGPRANLLPVFSLVRGQQPTATAAWEASPRPRFQRLGSSGAEAAPSLSTALASACTQPRQPRRLGGRLHHRGSVSLSRTRVRFQPMLNSV
mmetsp:Transcript_15496/g.27501  ORF Transcript_15496/g.27501 Transcript_15496/m.27501 type:complete len:137 (+) Transcript_15496:377-787(+)